MRLGQFFCVALISATTLSPLPASAVHFTGEFWKVAPDTLTTIDDAIAAVGGGSLAPTATFKSTVIDYGDLDTLWEIGSLSEFLNADAGSISGTDVPSIQESVFRISGTTFLEQGKDVSVTSDDGFRLIIDGNVFSEDPWLSSPWTSVSSPWLGDTGYYDVTLWYFEGHTWQGRLNSNLVPQIPVPASLVLLFSAVAGLGLALRRRGSAPA